MEKEHVIGLGIASAVAITGALTGTAPILIPFATLIAGGILGHAVPKRAENKAIDKEP